MFQPLHKAILPVADKPLILHAVDEVRPVGVEHFRLVTGCGKTASRGHRLEYGSNPSLLEEQRSFAPKRAAATPAAPPSPKGDAKQPAMPLRRQPERNSAMETGEVILSSLSRDILEIVTT